MPLDFPSPRLGAEVLVSKLMVRAGGVVGFQRPANPADELNFSKVSTTSVPMEAAEAIIGSPATATETVKMQARAAARKRIDFLLSLHVG